MTARRKSINFTQGVNSDHFYVQSFAGLAKYFASKLSEPTITALYLANVVLVVRQFMEENYGRGTAKPRNCTKLPHSMFHDFSLVGPLSHFLNNVFNILKTRNASLTDIVLGNTNLLEDLIKSGHASLLKEGLIKKPIVFFNKVPVGLINTLSRIVTEHCGEVTSNEESATHVINWNEEVDNFPEELSEDFIRILETKQVKGEGFAYVHWWYYPDCYDEWLSGSEVNPSDPPDISSTLNPKYKWNVCCRYILDCDVFNEWGNEIDYENDGQGDDGNNVELNLQNAKKSRNRKKANVVGGVKPPKEAPILEAVTVTEKILSDLLPPSLTSDLIPTVTMTIPVENTPQDAPQFVNANVRGVDGSSGSNTQSTLKRKFEDDVLGKDNKVVVRGPPSWFDGSSISTLEFYHLGQALSLKHSATATSNNSTVEDSRANANYIRIRQLIIGLYELNASQQLSVTECRRKISGDVSIVVKVFEFLNAYNIINYNVKSECRSVPSLQFTAKPQQCGIASPEPVSDKALINLAIIHKGDWQAVSLALDSKLHPLECAAKFSQVNVAESLFSGSAIQDLNRMSWLIGSELNPKTVNLAMQEISDLLQQQTVLLQKYMVNRQVILEEKLNLLNNVENLIEVKREELDVERKDLQIHGAQLASLRVQNGTVSQINL